MSTTLIPAAIDYLVTQVTALTACAAPVKVSDGYTASTANELVLIGVTRDDATTDTTTAWATLGQLKQDDEFTIPCVIRVYRGGADTVVKPARDAAFAIFDAIRTLVRTDPNMGGSLTGNGLAGWALIDGVRLDQTNDPDEAGQGRVARIFFNVHCRTRF